MSYDLEMEDYQEEIMIKNAPKTYLVTGGAGFVGTNLIKRLLMDGHKVICIDNYSTGSEENHQGGCEYYKADIRNKFSINQRIDVIFHMAALARIQPSIKEPITAIQNNLKNATSSFANATGPRKNELISNYSKKITGAARRKIPASHTALKIPPKFFNCALPPARTRWSAVP